MEMYQIRYFLATCETLNLTKAAEASNVSQPALTKALKLLEDELGGSLFDRRARPLRLTELGKRLENRFRAIADITDEITANAKLFKSLNDATYTLGMISTIGSEPFDRIIRAIRSRAPGISLSLRLIPQGELVEELRTGDLELAVITNDVNDTEEFETTPLYDEPYFLAMDERHVLAMQETVRLQDLGRVEYVNRTHCELNQRFDQLARDQGVVITNRLSTDQDAIACDMIEAGLGVSMMPHFLCDSIPVKKTISDLHLERSLVLAQRPGRTLSESASTIRDIIITAAGEMAERFQRLTD
ncbi:MAG: LysR family transcriptional regulator [Pseudomonadota bacterium]